MLDAWRVIVIAMTAVHVLPFTFILKLASLYVDICSFIIPNVDWFYKLDTHFLQISAYYYHKLNFNHVRNVCRTCYNDLHQIRSMRRPLTTQMTSAFIHDFICARIYFGNALDLFWSRFLSYLETAVLS